MTILMYVTLTSLQLYTIIIIMLLLLADLSLDGHIRELAGTHPLYRPLLAMLSESRFLAARDLNMPSVLVTGASCYAEVTVFYPGSGRSYR